MFVEIEPFLTEEEMNDIKEFGLYYHNNFDYVERAKLVDYKDNKILIIDPQYQIGWHTDNFALGRQCVIIHPVWPKIDYVPCETEMGNSTGVILLDVTKRHNVNNDTDNVRINLQIEFNEPFDKVGKRLGYI